VRHLAVVALVLGLALAGCGGGDDETGAVRSTVQAYIDAFVKGDGARTCALMTARTRAQFVKGARPLAQTDDCAKAVVAVRGAAGPKAIGAMRAARISNVKVDGRSATAVLSASSGQSIATLTKEAGHWRVSSTFGSE
jgi:hypothetical protein